MKIAIIDYQAGNLGNVKKSIESLGCICQIISESQSLEAFDGIVLPGVGSFNKGMNFLNNSGLSKDINSAVLKNNKPILGICLGMQLLCKQGNEGGFIEGLGLINACVEKFNKTIMQERIPHMGWNDISLNKNSILFKDIPDNSDFYFAHSYFVSTNEKKIIAANCKYGNLFAAAIEKENIFATQFHPEKSQRYGYRLLKNFLDLCKNNMEAK